MCFIKNTPDWGGREHFFQKKKGIFVKDREVGGKSTNALQLSSNKHPQEWNISVCLRRNECVSVYVG